jgi:hypothetical protein
MTAAVEVRDPARQGSRRGEDAHHQVRRRHLAVRPSRSRLPSQSQWATKEVMPRAGHPLTTIERHHHSAQSAEAAAPPRTPTVERVGKTARRRPAVGSGGLSQTPSLGTPKWALTTSVRKGSTKMVAYHTSTPRKRLAWQISRMQTPKGQPMRQAGHGVRDPRPLAG